MSNEPREVVGVVGEVRVEQLDGREPEPTIYLPTAQLGFSNTTLVIRTTVPPNNLTRAVIGAVRAVDAEQPVLDIMTMDAVVEESLGQRRFAMWLLAGFAGLALLLASSASTACWRSPFGSGFARSASGWRSARHQRWSSAWSCSRV